MNTAPIMTLSVSFIAGVALGGFYFTALWKTVRRLPTCEHPVRLMLISFVMRAAVLAGGLYLIMNGHWERLAAAVAGLMVMRIILTRFWGPQKTAPAVQQTTI
jgi:F1F0 ATPase subunit 2